MSRRTLAALGAACALLVPGGAWAHGKVPPPAGEVAAEAPVDAPTPRRTWLLLRPRRAERPQAEEPPPSRFHQPWTNDVPIWREDSYSEPAPYVVMHALPAS
jgi:hypothetical protein